jgi:cyclophilin family peptidyl-prolyl cis-trans isomerase
MRIGSSNHCSGWSLTIKRATATLVGVSLLAGAAWSAAVAAADVPVVEEDSAATATGAKQSFAKAQQELKRLIGELAALQAEYQQPGANKQQIEARFNAARDEARAAAASLETSAMALVQAEPDNEAAIQVVRDVIQGAMASDDPQRVLAVAETLRDGGAADAPILLAGATAAMTMSKLEEATEFVKAAAAAGVNPGKIESLEQAIASERPKVEAEMAKRAAEAEADDLPRVKIETTKGEIVVELFENEAANTVANFISLVEQHFYDGTPFHRVIPQFMAQGGDPTGTGTGGPGYAIACECETPAARKHFLGSLSMAHAGKNTGGSQFFLTFRPTEHLDGRHTVFGRVIEGFSVLPKLQRTEGEQAGGEPDKILKAEVLRKRDHDYVPDKLPSRR